MQCKPKDISLDLMGSVFGNLETEIVLRNILLMLRATNVWKPFTLEDYTNFCNHDVTSEEYDVIKALTYGGKPYWKCSTYLSPGWIEFNESTNCYSFSNRLIEALQRDHSVSVTANFGFGNTSN